SPEPQYPRSTSDDALDRARRPETLLLPLFGVSGCGKTRTAIEMLCKNWGFYFNASITDWGSNDLSDLLVSVQQMQRYQHRDLNSNTQVHLLALALVLGRVITLQHCLDITEHEGTTFACKDWMLLQVACHTLGFDDLLTELFTLLANVIRLHNVNIHVMRDFVQTRVSELRQRLLRLAPNQDMGERILLVIDEAQNLGKDGCGAFLSQQRPGGSQDKTQTLSESAPVPLEAVRCDNGLLNSRAAIVGLDEHMLGTDHRSMSLTAVSMESRDTLNAFATVKADAVQRHLGDNKLQTFCTVSPKRYLGVVVAYPTELPGAEGSFAEVRRSERILGAQEEETPQCISLKIDKDNIHGLFPEAHMKVLDRLKNIKRELEQSRDDPADDHAAKQRRL
ncbi:hypothetical protein BGX29_003215, partial [Mortierella sp. GBA35]